MKTLEMRIIVVLFCILLALPLALYLCGVRGEIIENRNAHKRPDISVEAMMNAEWFRQFDLYLQDKLPLREQFISNYNLIGWHILKDTNNPAVTRGIDDWLFHNDGLMQPCVSPQEIRAQVMKLVQIAKAARIRWNTRIIWVIAPDKEAIYPEKLHPHQKNLGHCSFSNRETIRELIREDAISPYILGLWDALEEEKEQQKNPLYQQYDTHWNHYGSAYGGARAIIDYLHPNLWSAANIGAFTHRQTQPDLLKLLGIRNMSENEPIASSNRPGVRVQTARPECVSERVKRRKSYRLEHTSNPPVTTIGGKTVFIHDSFLYAMENHLTPYLEQMEMSHIEAFWKHHADQITACADTLIFETLERNFLKRIPAIVTLYERTGLLHDAPE